MAGRKTNKYITDFQERQSCYKRRSKTLVSTTSQLEMLCDVRACIVLYNPDEDVVIEPPRVWPNNVDEFSEVFELYKARTRLANSAAGASTSAAAAGSRGGTEGRFGKLTAEEALRMIGAVERRMGEVQAKIDWFNKGKNVVDDQQGLQTLRGGAMMVAGMSEMNYPNSENYYTYTASSSLYNAGNISATNGVDNFDVSEYLNCNDFEGIDNDHDRQNAFVPSEVGDGYQNYFYNEVVGSIDDELFQAPTGEYVMQQNAHQAVGHGQQYYFSNEVFGTSDGQIQAPTGQYFMQNAQIVNAVQLLENNIVNQNAAPAVFSAVDRKVVPKKVFSFSQLVSRQKMKSREKVKHLA